MPNETPFIKLKAMSAVDGHDVIFYICEQQGEWTEPFVYEGIKIQPPFERPEWREGARILFPRGSSTSLNNTPMLATVQEYEKICAAVDAFNEHYAKRAEEPKGFPCFLCGEPNVPTRKTAHGLPSSCDQCWNWLRDYFVAEEKAKKEAEKTEEPRRILDVITLGSETTATECRNCVLHKRCSKGWLVPECIAHGALAYNTEDGGKGYLRHTDCLAAEKRYEALRAMMGGDNASSDD